ncbi:MAG: PD-(D/E)XK nuclease family protein, partial [Verrucomicrobiota bacterium]|nr:PD-(D/E)XK nuclease family protein [Verrucomicrobiota bacterium]
LSDAELRLINCLSDGKTRVGMSADTAGTSACATFLADNIEREADEIARRILLESEKGIAFREMGIVIRNRKVYEPILRATLERFGIPARFYFDSPLLDHPVTRFITGLVDSKLSGWEHEQTLAALKLAPSTGVSAAMDRLDIGVREQLPNRGIGKLLALAQSDEILTKLIESSSAGVRDRPNPRDLFRPGKIKDEIPWSAVAMYRSQAAAVKAFEQAIEECSAWCAAFDRPVPFVEYWRTLKTILRLTPLRVPDQRRNVVHALSAYEARQWDLPVLFVCGLIESEFPQRHPQNAFLPDPAIEGLQRAGIRLRTSADRNAEETFLFDSGVARASTLYLSYPRVDGRGEPYAPSAFISRVKTVEDPCRRVRPASLPAPEKWKPASAIVHPELLRVFNERHTKFSATALESYLQCPFQFFATKTLRLREFPPRPEDRLDFLVRGNIVHKALAEWFVERPPIEPLFERIFHQACSENHVPLGYRTEMWRHRLLQDLQRFCAEDAWPRGAHIETEKKFQFELDEGIAVTGRIDRLESLPDGSAIVIDYKYSKAVNARKLIEDATKLQAPIYLLAIERAFGLKPAAMVYYSLRDELKIHGRGTVSGLQARLEPLTREWLDEAQVRIVESVRRLRAGRIVPAPASADPCRYCDVRDVCRFEGAAVRTAGGE